MATHVTTPLPRAEIDWPRPFNAAICLTTPLFAAMATHLTTPPPAMTTDMAEPLCRHGNGFDQRPLLAVNGLCTPTLLMDDP